ncbi:SdrD B-like domain-containing protein [Spirosoma oryzicola]|uniref:Ig-like domain-containing protein n=1 Tax=Spirosoma oryzicola TaxID=2898794 RepID=UPI001E415273|nr:SdrD B-like domain-containing protein [Spirosoma oryzicola]
MRQPRQLVSYAFSLIAFFLLSSVSLQAQPTTVDLSVSTKISKQNPTLGEPVTYTVIVRNAIGSANATNVIVKNQLPAGGVSYVAGSSSLVRGRGNYDAATGIWSVGAIAPNDSAVLTLQATVLGRGVWFNTAEVVSADQRDVDSQPNNASLTEDDYEAVCFSVPILWYAGDEFVVSVPSGYKNIVWYRNDSNVTTISADLAVVNADSSLSIKSPGSYRFTTTLNGCSALNCCNIDVIQGVYGSLGDLVFADTNKDGLQQTGESGIAGVKVVLLDSNNQPLKTTTTNANGIYAFSELTPSVPYSISFVAPAGYQFTGSSSIDGVDDTKNSDVNPVTGQTRSVTLAVGEVNNNLDAGLYSSCPTDYSLVASANASICSGDSIKLTATSLPGAKICWFLTPTDENPLAIVDNGDLVTFKPTITTTYYVEASINGCYSARKSVTITVNVVPTPTIRASIKNACPAQTVNLANVVVSNSNPAFTYEWYTNVNRSQTTRVADPTNVGAGTYYLFARSTDGCYSSPAVLTVDLVNCGCPNLAEVKISSGTAACSVNPVSLTVTISGSVTTVGWTSNGTGTFNKATGLTTTYTPSAADVASGTVLITATTNDPDGPGGVCSASTSSFILKIGKLPDAPTRVTADDTLVCQGGETKLVGFASGARINWYDESNTLLMTTESGSKFTVRPTLVGLNTYYAEAVTADNCVSATRTSVVVRVAACQADLAVVTKITTAGPYSVGQKITYSITASNNGPATGTDVKVQQLLPSALTFAGATPADSYNQSTGIWTIGTLTAGSSRTLYLEATINSTASTRTTATISGSNNDPNYRQNDTSSVGIPTNQCGIQAPTIVGAVPVICTGDVTTLQASGCGSGTVRWSDGQTGATISVKPTVTTTYSASCVVNSCVSDASNLVTVTIRDPQQPVLTASAGTVCAGSSVTLTASGCAGGTIEWSEGPQTGASIVVKPYTRTTYTAQCRVGNCLSNPAVQTIDIVTEVGSPTITASQATVCPGETVTLTVAGCVGTPIWSSTTATTSSIVVTPSIGNNSYSVYCRNGACISKTSNVYTITVAPLTVPTVSADVDSTCAKGKVTLTATGCTGTVIWSTKQTGTSIIVYPEASTSYYALCKVGNNCLSESSKSVTVTVASPSAPIVSASSLSVCSGNTVTLRAIGCGGTVKWYGADRIGASVDIRPAATQEYYATCTVGNCESAASNKVRITVATSGVAAPTVRASTLATCSGSVVSLTATGCTGEVVWSDGQVGGVVSVTATPTNKSFYAVCRTGTQCASGSSNVINLNVTPTPTPTITASQTAICPGGEVKLSVNNCQGTPHWNTGETTSSITVTPKATTAYTVYCQEGTCRSQESTSAIVTVVPVAVPTITASATAIESTGTVTLTATGCTGEVIWSANDINGNNKGAVLVVRPDGTQTYYAQCKLNDCLSDASISITISPNKGDCVTKAGTLTAVSPTVCVATSSTVTVAATPGTGLVKPTGYSVLYVLTKGTELVITQTAATPSFNVPAQAADYTIHTLVYNATVGDKNYLDLSAIKLAVTTGADVKRLIADQKICADLDLLGAKVSVKAVSPPVLSASPSTTVCYGAQVTLTATGCEGGTVTWSDGLTGQSIKKTVTSGFSTTATCTQNGCVSAPSAILSLTITTPAIPVIVANTPAVCTSETVSLTATGCAGGTYIWSDPASTTGTVLTGTPTATTQYRVKCKLGECESDWSAYNTITVGAPAAPTATIVNAGVSTSICAGSSVTLRADGCQATSEVVWSTGQVGRLITIVPTATASYTARCRNSSICSSASSNAVTVSVSPAVLPPTVLDRTNTCPATTVNLITAVTSKVTTTGGIFEYYTDASLTSVSKVASASAVGTGTYYVVEKTVGGCYSQPVAIHVQVISCQGQTPCDPQNPATADAGVDASICAAKTYQLAGKMGGAGKVAQWTTSGSGTFTNPFALDAVYNASANDVAAGKVTLTLSVSTNNASCPVASDQLVLTIQGSSTVPVVSILGSTKLCAGDSVTLKAPDGATGYKWNTNVTTQNIVVRTSGRYSVQVLDAGGCSSVKSADVVVEVAAPLVPPLVNNLRNACPAKVVDLTKALSSTSVGSSYIYRTCACTASNLVLRPDSVGQGTYWVVERNATGCLSAPSRIEVKVFNCAADTLDTDVSIAKTVNKPAVKRGETVTYTITVTNNGKYTARNIDVQDALPKGLELVLGSTPNYTLSNDIITRRIDSLPAGKSESITFSARLLTKEKVVNTAKITYLDNKDLNLANNTSSVTVQDTSTTKASVIGLAKAVVGTPVNIADSLIAVRYGFVIKNFGDDTLKNVLVTDDLAYAFSPNQIQSVAISSTNTDFSLKQNPAFTGRGDNTHLFDSTSYLAPGRTQTFFLDVTVRRVVGDTTRTFRNIASASALSSGVKVEDLSVNGGDVDPDNDGNPTNNTGFTVFTLGAPQLNGPGIGVALAVTNVRLQPDSSYNVTYKATVKNVGSTPLYGVSLVDSLSKTFASPASYSVVGTPIVGANSTLVANTAFNGNTATDLLTRTSYLNIGVQDTVLITVNVKPNRAVQPFYSSVVGRGRTADSSRTVTDISNDGFDPNPQGAVATAVRFNLPSALIGVAKWVGTPALVQAGIYDIPYIIRLSNMGREPLYKVQVVDNLSQTFGRGALIIDNIIPVSTDAGLVGNPSYTGQGVLTNMLIDSLSSLPVGASRQLGFTVRVNVKNADTLTFYNRAYAVAQTEQGLAVADTSTSGLNPDPANTLDPRNSNIPTPVSLDRLSTGSYIGVAMAVADTSRQPNGSYNVTYQIVVQNFGYDTLTQVSLSDSLVKVFNSQTGARYSVVRTPFSSSTGSRLKLNDRFDGNAQALLVIGDDTSVLLPRQTDTIRIVVNVASNGTTTTFFNSVYAQALSRTGIVSDVSTNGLIPDLNGNNNPTDDNEREATPLTLPVDNSAVFIPEGFSPNGDGINDLFIIRGLQGLTISLEVYNRWGNLVYQNQDYLNDWDGKANTGLMLGSDADGLPDGTYYYMIRTSDGRQFVRYLTINR